MKIDNLDNGKMSKYRKKKHYHILPEAVADIAVLLGLAAIVICVIFGLEGNDDG